MNLASRHPSIPFKSLSVLAGVYDCIIQNMSGFAEKLCMNVQKVLVHRRQAGKGCPLGFETAQGTLESCNHFSPVRIFVSSLSCSVMFILSHFLAFKISRSRTSSHALTLPFLHSTECLKKNVLKCYTYKMAYIFHYVSIYSKIHMYEKQAFSINLTPADSKSVNF